MVASYCQTGAITSGSWSQTSDKSLVIQLDPKQYRNRFPEIEISSPRFKVLVSETEKKDVKISGLTYTCLGGWCRGGLPPLMYPAAPLQPGWARHWQPNS